MAVTKTLQAVGDFTVKLLPSVPRSLVDAYAIATDGYSLLIVTPTWMDPKSLTAAQLRGLSMYTGIYRKEESASRVRYDTLSGTHATAWLGDDTGKGQLYEGAAGPFTKNLQDWVSHILSPLTTVTSGSIQTNATTLTWSYQWGASDASSPRQALDYVCGFYNVNYQVNDDLSVDVGDAVTLWGSLPYVLATPWWQGRDGGIYAIRSFTDPEGDVDSYATRVLASGGGFAAGTGSGSPYLDPFGNTLAWKEKFDVTAASSSADVTNQAGTELARINAAAQMPNITTDAAGVMAYLRPGQDVEVWHPEADLSSISGGLLFVSYYRAEPIWPVPLQVQSITMPLEFGMGVYLQRSSDNSIVDLTRYVEWEQPGAQIQVGAQRLRLRDTVKQRGGRFAA
jgi:hypothetical protein